MPAPPSKKVLAELDSSMVEHGELETGIPCVPITIEKRVEGKLRTTEAHSRKFTLVDICQRLLNRHEKYMWQLRIKTEDYSHLLKLRFHIIR